MYEHGLQRHLFDARYRQARELAKQTICWLLHYSVLAVYDCECIMHTFCQMYGRKKNIQPYTKFSIFSLQFGRGSCSNFFYQVEIFRDPTQVSHGKCLSAQITRMNRKDFGEMVMGLIWTIAHSGKTIVPIVASHQQSVLHTPIPIQAKTIAPITHACTHSLAWRTLIFCCYFFNLLLLILFCCCRESTLLCKIRLIRKTDSLLSEYVECALWNF